MTRILSFRRGCAAAASFALVLSSCGCGSGSDEQLATLPIGEALLVAEHEDEESSEFPLASDVLAEVSQAFAARHVLEAPASAANRRSPARGGPGSQGTPAAASRDPARDPGVGRSGSAAPRNAVGGTGGPATSSSSPGLSAGGSRGGGGGGAASGPATSGATYPQSNAGDSGLAARARSSSEAAETSGSSAPLEPSQPPPTTGALFEGDGNGNPETSGGSFTTFGSSTAVTPARGSSAIPPPFEPLSLNTIAGGYEVRAWGRAYRFSGPLPRSITSQERELLAAPAALLVDGEPLSWGPVRLVENRADRIVLEADAVRGTLAFHAAVLIEYDGMIQLDLSVSGDGSIPSLSYELPLRSNHATLFNHHLAYDYVRQNVDKGSIPDSAGTTPNGTRRFDFVPSFWLGDRDVGIEWWSESNATWHGPEVARPYELQRTSSQTRLRVEPISAPRPLVSGEVWSDRVSLFPMPMRPPLPDWRAVRFTSAGTSTPRFDEAIGTRLVWIAFGTAFSARWHGLPHAKPDAQQEDLRRRLERRGVEYIPYGKLTVAPSKHPKSLAMFEQWSASGTWATALPPGDIKVLAANRVAHQHGDPVTYGVCMARSDYLDWMLEENLGAFDAEQLDGVYFDHGSITRMCTRGPLLRERPGREAWEYSNVRDFYKRLYTGLKKRRPDALLVIHTGSQPRALSAFVDFHWTGEHLNTIFSGGSNRATIDANPADYHPDYLALPDGFLDAMTLPHAGGVSVILPEIKFARDPNRMRPAHRALHGWALVSDVPVILGNTDNDEATAIFRAVDRFGNLAGADFEPWWSQTRSVSVDPPLRGSVYRAGGRALVVLLNRGASAVERSVSLDPAALGVSGAPSWSDPESSSAPVPLVNGRVSVRVPARDFRLVLIE